MGNLDKAIEIAARAHAGQKDKAGNNYILHPLRMMMGMKTDEEKIVAVLHDVVEDSDFTFEDLSEAGFSSRIVNAVEHLTNRDDEGYEAFISRVMDDDLAVNVKIADLEDNMDLTRLQTVDQKAKKRLERYHRAHRRLKGQRESKMRTQSQ